MKKFIFTLMLAAAGGAWSGMQAICMASFRPQTGETEYFSGRLIWVAMPCEGGEDVPCPPCMTVALQTASDRTTYYLTGLDQETQDWIESEEDLDFWSITIAGARFTSGSYKYIQVDRIWKRCMSDISMCDDKMNVTICGTLRPYVLTGDEDQFFDIPAGSETVVLESADGTYFLHWDSKEDLQTLLDTLQTPLSVMVSGQWDCYDHLICIIVHGITIGDCRPVRIMCDEWNVLMTYDMGPDEVKYETVRYSLGTDTVIGDKLYQQLLRGGDYDGAIREGDNRNIFIVPRGSTHEYLLYEFNVNDLGKNVSNLWIGGQADSSPNGYEATVRISKGGNNRRYYDVSVKVADGVTLTAHWLEGIGSLDGPSGSRCPAIVCEGDMGQALLCAYKDGEQVYASEEAERFGCWYDSSKPTELPSLCDKWNVLHWPFIGDQLKWMNYHLTTDTVINAKRYVKLEIPAEKAYKGALREGNNKDIYIVPADNTQEYLLYSFNAQARDTLNNLWLGETAGFYSGYSGYFGIVANISDSQPRIFTIDIESYDERHTQYVTPIRWIEGVGFESVPEGDWCPAPCAADYGTNEVLCAYKDGEQVYASEESERFGCWYDSNEQQADTVKMYVQDGPGSSTVDPVDPNQIVVIVKDGQLIIREYLDIDLTFTLERIGALHAPARNDATQSDTFHESVAIPLTESGVYQLTLTHPDWGYSIVGTFEYTITGMPETVAQTAAQKIIRDGRLLIRQGGKTFTLTGVEVK